MSDATPPRLAEKLLALAVPNPDWQDTIVGDLREEFATETDRRGFTAARAWYWRQSVSIATRLIAARLRGRRVQPRGWVAVADVDGSSGWFTGATRDLAYAWRGVTHRPGLSATIVVTLALALAANSTIFAVLDAIVIRPFRFPGVEQLVVVSSSDSNDLIDVESVSYGDYQDWRSLSWVWPGTYGTTGSAMPTF